MSSSATPRAVAVPTAVGVVVAAVVAVLAVVALMLSVTEDRLPSGPALAPPPPPAREVGYDSVIRQAGYGKARVTMPGDPYQCAGTPQALAPLLSSALVCGTVVHADYRGTDDWSATVVFGSVPDALTKATAEETAAALFAAVREQSFNDQPTTLGPLTRETITLSGREVTAVSGDVRYEIAGLPSTYDRLLVAALPLEDGEFAAYVSSRPNDTPRATLDVLNESIGSLRYI